MVKSEGDSNKAKFEDILSLAGDQGKWQIIIFMVTWIECILIGCHHLSSSFLGGSMDHWCNTEYIQPVAAMSHWTLEQKKQYALPFNNDTEKYESCEMFDITGISIPADFNTAIAERPQQLPTVHCESMKNVPNDKFFQYDTSENLETIVNSWDLVCSRLPLLSTVQGSYMGGVFVGCIFFGWASDKFGRRLTMLVSAAIQIFATIATAFSVDYVMFIFLRFLVAFSASGVFECGFVLVTEVCGPKYRTVFGILTQLPFGIGASLLPLIAYFLRNWVNLQLAISIPSVLLIVYYFFVPESPRWLLGEGRIDEALKILKDCAKVNGNTLPPDDELYSMVEHFKESREEAAKSETEIKEPKTLQQNLYTIFKELIILFETPEMRKRTFNVFYSWMVVAMVYYGLSFNSKNLGGNRYVSTFISGFVEIPAVILIVPLLGKFGRVKCYCFTFIGGGICCGLVAIATFSLEIGEKVWIPVAFAMTGKFLISMTFAIAYLYTAELFPTPVRNIAVGAASTFARIGSMIVPYIVDILGAINVAIPVIIFGIISFTAGLFSLMLPETLNKKLPESVEEVENYRENLKAAQELSSLPSKRVEE